MPWGDDRPRGVACKIGKANNLTNLQCIQCEIAYMSTFSQSCIGLECKCQAQATPRYITKLRDSQFSVMSIMLKHDHSCIKSSKLSDIRVSDKCRPT